MGYEITCRQNLGLKKTGVIAFLTKDNRCCSDNESLCVKIARTTIVAAHFRMPEKAFSGAINSFSRCNNSIYSICTFSAQENLSRPSEFDCYSCISWYKSKMIPSGTSSSSLSLSDSSLQGRASSQSDISGIGWSTGISSPAASPSVEARP